MIWASISLVPEAWREPFTIWAQNEVVHTRARVAIEDKHDPEALAAARVEQIDWYSLSPIEREHAQAPAPDWASRVPMKRFRTENEPIQTVIWQHVEYGTLNWDAASFYMGGGKDNFNTILTGIEFDASMTAPLGLSVNSSTFNGAQPNSTSAIARGAKRKDQWPDWIAYLALAVFEGGLRADMTETDALRAVADRMASDGLDEMARSTVQRAMSRVLEVLRAAA